MTEKRFVETVSTGIVTDNMTNKEYNCEMRIDDDFLHLINNIVDENEQLKSDLKDCKKLKGKRLKKIRNHRAVIEELGGVIRAYKGKLSQANEKIEKIKEAMEDTGALTKRQLEEILK